MEILGAQFLTIAIFFLSMLVCCLLPMQLVNGDYRSSSSVSSDSSAWSGKRYYGLFISLANCLSAGVFLATFFVGLLPEVRKEFEALLSESKIVTDFPVTEFVVSLGFFLAVFVEQLLATCRRCYERHSTARLTPSSPSTSSQTLLLSPSSTNGNSQVVHDQCHEHELLPSSDEHQHHSHYHGHNDHNHNSHNHSHDFSSLVNPVDSGIRVGMLLLSLGVHSIFEGMTLGLQTHLRELVNLFIGVLIHECLVAFAMGISIAKMKLKFSSAFRLALLFSTTLPIGQMIGLVIGHQQTSNSSSASSMTVTLLQAVAAGTFIQVTFFEVIPEGLSSNHDHDDHGSGGVESNNAKFLKILFLVLGFVVIALIPLFAQVHDHKRDSERDDYENLLQLKRNTTTW